MTTAAVRARTDRPYRGGAYRRQQDPDWRDLISGPPSDPARVLPLQKRYSAQLYKAFRRVKGYIRETVADNNALGIDPTTPMGQATPARGPVSDFDFPSEPDRREAFLRWLDHNLRREAIEQVDHTLYFRSAYGRGVTHADALLGPESDVDLDDLQHLFNAPVHARTVEVALTRSLDTLAGINRAVSAAAAETLAEGLIHGWNPNKTARAINDRVDAIGIHRARLLARTETQHAVAEGTLNRFEQQGTERVVVLAEFTTAGDQRVCPECEAIEGRVFTVEEARGVVPVHPFCRCQFAPVRQVRPRR